ncbi:hypothetical protein [Microvirga arsenatis]|uniref:Uncharacterized protein n=1 Tax=Microvirga arsenatis TaxID=2692265 RepID=A0ABW9YYE1_9HYPH|nr:hypothetical protein [Microvirga arsenatis]NBJ13354.1 hypothetical protein [Microvirga arsenatis]NBJ24138.1 hypothetical protein [Microvirga arsenatis]
MILYTDEQGRYLGHLDQVYPAPPGVLEKVRAEQEGKAWDIPPWNESFWYFPDGVPTIRPKLDYTVTETREGEDTVAVISGIPAGVTVNVHGPEGGQSVEADGENLELVLRIAGQYAVTFDPFPYQPVSILIEAKRREG